jgi:antitoxin component YwqK of YwqJK toxin-antitoxin module
MKYLIPVLCAVGLLFAGCVTNKPVAPKPTIEAPMVVVDGDQLRFQGEQALFLIGEEQGEESLDGVEDLWYFKEKPFTGVAVWKYPNGQKERETTFRDGKRHGLGTAWYENGQKDRETTVKDGVPVAVTVWKPNGEKCPDTNLVDGNGITCYYHDNGQKRSEHTYKDGKEHGLGTAWYENGQKSAEYTFKDGKMDGLRTSWHDNGQKAVEATFKDGEQISQKWWDKDGNPR